MYHASVCGCAMHVRVCRDALCGCVRVRACRDVPCVRVRVRECVTRLCVSYVREGRAGGPN